MHILFATVAALVLHVQGGGIPQLPGQGLPADDTEAARKPLQEHPELCSPAIEEALMQVLSEEAEFDSLSRPLEEDGVIVEEPGHYNERLFGEGAPFRKYIARNRARFDLRGQDAPGISYVADLIRYDAGFRAGEKLVTTEDFEADGLLALFTPNFFAAAPIWDSDEARRYHESERSLGDLAPLGNGAALAYLTFGVLYQDDYWDAEEHDREAFVSQLLAKGFDGRFVAIGVDRALAPPLLPPRKKTKRAGRGAAGSLKNLRGKVGFTKLHEEQLVTDLETMRADLREPVLTEVLERGSSFDKCSALLNSDWLPAELLERTASDLLDEYRAPATSSFLRGSISCGIMGGLFAQEDQAKSAALLKDIIQEGLWVEGEDASSWYPFLNNP